MARRLRLSSAVALLLLSACASREKTKGVLVTRNREQVTECAYLGRVSAGELEASQASEPPKSNVQNSGMSELALRQEAARMGANVLLLLSEGAAAEAYLCEKRMVLSAAAKKKRQPTPIGLPVPLTPTPARWPAGSR